MLRRLALIAVLFVAACTNANDLNRAGVSLGDFALGHNVVVAPKMVKGPTSRDATEDEWKAALTAAVDERFGRYEETGSKLYHIAVSVEGYILAAPGIPLVLSPKSVLIFNVTIWDDAARKKLNDKPHQITVLETASGETLLGSGLTQTKEEQLQNLSRNAAKEIQNWMRIQIDEKGWFGGAAAANAGPAARNPAPVTTEPPVTAATPAPATAASTAAPPVATPVAAPQATPSTAAAPAQQRRLPVAAAPGATAPALVIPDETILEPAVAPPPRAPASQG